MLMILILSGGLPKSVESRRLSQRPLDIRRASRAITTIDPMLSDNRSDTLEKFAESSKIISKVPRSSESSKRYRH